MKRRYQRMNLDSIATHSFTATSITARLQKRIKKREKAQETVCLFAPNLPFACAACLGDSPLGFRWHPAATSWTWTPTRTPAAPRDFAFYSSLTSMPSSFCLHSHLPRSWRVPCPPCRSRWPPPTSWGPPRCT